MKKLIFFFAALLCLAGTLKSQSREFRLGFTGAYPHNYEFSVTNNFNWSWYQELSMNRWQAWWIDEKKTSVISNLGTYDIGGYLQIDTIIWAAHGKVQVNEAESNTPGIFKYYNLHSSGQDYEESFGYARHYDAPSTPFSSPQTILSEFSHKGLFSFAGLPIDPMYEQWFPSRGGLTSPANTWYIKPKMRISTADAFGTEKNVVKIIIKDFDTNSIKTVVLTTQNFRYNDIFTYDGRYLEEFFPNVDLTVSGVDINTGRPEQYLETWLVNNSGVDIEIQWYGEVDVWIDYVKVQDQAAEKLMHPDPQQSMRGDIKRRLDSLYIRPDKDMIKGFYTEEIEYNNLTCIKYLNDYISSLGYTGVDFKVKSLINPKYSYQAYLSIGAAGIDGRLQEYFDLIEPEEVFYAYYPFYNSEEPSPYFAVLPNNVDMVDINHYPSWVMTEMHRLDNNFTLRYTPSNYNIYLQNIWDKYVEELEVMNNNPDVMLLSVPQVHIWKENNSNYYLREPLNSELSGLFYIGLCRGTRGVMPYSYESGYWGGTTPFHQTGVTWGNGVIPDEIDALPIPNFSFGMGEFSTANNNGHLLKREKNFYGEDKWDHVEDAYDRMEKWGPIIANSNTTQGYSVHEDGADHNFITDIKSIYRDPQSPYEYDAQNEDATKYWEMGFFYPDYLSALDRSKYFMMVNRRCVPEIDGGDGDYRQLKIKFDGNDLTGFNNWKIIDVYTEQEVATFDKNANQYIDFGQFLPGEGKMFKLAPVMQEGGEFVTNEYLGQNVVCNDIVYTDGYNLDIPIPRIVEFKAAGKVIMEGGSFFCGYHPGNGEDEITLKGNGSDKWTGILLDGCDTVKVDNTVVQNIEDYDPPTTYYAFDIINCSKVTVSDNTFTGYNTGGVRCNYTSASGVNILITIHLV